MSRWRGGTVVPASEKNAVQCALSGQSGAARSIGYCVRVARGPLVVTDLHVTGACPADLFALGGSVGEPRFVAYLVKNTLAHVTGASLAVAEGTDLIIGITAPSEARIGRDLSCSVTWAGWALNPVLGESVLDDRF